MHYSRHRYRRVLRTPDSVVGCFEVGKEGHSITA